MDDELPLTALAKPANKKSYDDDMPLTMLASSASKPRPSAGGAPAAGKRPLAPGAARPRPKAAAKGSSSSSSDSSDSSSSDSSSDSKPLAGGKSKKKKIRLIAPKKKKKVDTDDREDDEENKLVKKARSAKEQVAVDFLCRWWYAMPDWPPADPAFYEAELKKRQLRRVSIQEWEWVPETDDKGNAKVYELSQFKGLFRKSDGEMVDLRPMDTCPSYNNMMKKDLQELYGLLIKAYEGQLEDLKNSKYSEKVIEEQLKGALSKIKMKAGQAKEMAFATGQTANKMAGK